MADIVYSLTENQNLGLKFKFEGYNDKLAYFVQTFFETLK
jgi:hypothetical protein